MEWVTEICVKENTRVKSVSENNLLTEVIVSDFQPDLLFPTIVNEVRKFLLMKDNLK